MKKILVFGLVLILVSVTASAQKFQQERLRKYRMEQRFFDRQPNRPERFKLRNDMFRYKMAHRRALKDGRVGPMERRRLMMMRQHNRREMFRFRNNRIRRVI